MKKIIFSLFLLLITNGSLVQSSEIEQFYYDFDVDPGCDKQELSRAARTSVALETLVNNERLGGMAYYYEGSDDKRYEDIITSVIPGNTLLTMHGVPVVGEYEIKKCPGHENYGSYGHWR